MSAMGGSIEAGGVAFNLGMVGAWMDANPWKTGILIVVGITFWVTRPGGFGSEMLRYLTARNELAARRIDGWNSLSERLENRSPEEQMKLPINEPEVLSDPENAR